MKKRQNPDPVVGILALWPQRGGSVEGLDFQCVEVAVVCLHIEC